METNFTVLSLKLPTKLTSIMDQKLFGTMQSRFTFFLFQIKFQVDIIQG